MIIFTDFTQPVYDKRNGARIYLTEGQVIARNVARVSMR